MVVDPLVKDIEAVRAILSTIQGDTGGRTVSDADVAAMSKRGGGKIRRMSYGRGGKVSAKTYSKGASPRKPRI